MMGRYIVLILFAFLVEGVFGEEKSVNDGDPVILKTNVTKRPQDMVRWYFDDRLIALINGDPSTSCLYDGEGMRFRDRLKVDYETGSLIITNTRTEHTGHYEAELIRSSGKSESLNRSPKCDSTKMYKKNIKPEDIIITFSLTVSDSGSGLSPAVPGSGLSPAAVAGICVGVVGGVVLLLLAAAVGGKKFTHCSIFDMKKNKQVPELVSNDEPFLPAENGKV